MPEVALESVPDKRSSQESRRGGTLTYTISENGKMANPKMNQGF
jgi:hypothetical protein